MGDERAGFGTRGREPGLTLLERLWGGMRAIAPGVHVIEAPQRFLGLEMGARTTVLSLEGGVLVHSPVAVPPETVAPAGDLRWVVCPNLLHHLHAGPWIEAGAEGWAAPGLAAKRADLAFAGELEGTEHPFGDEVAILPLRCFPFANEVAVLHRPSRTLVLTDLVFNLSDRVPWITRAAMACACGYPGCRSTLLERALMNRALAREEIGTLLGWDFDRLVMSHGEIVETGGREALAGAYAWLGVG